MLKRFYVLSSAVTTWVLQLLGKTLISMQGISFHYMGCSPREQTTRLHRHWNISEFSSSFALATNMCRACFSTILALAHMMQTGWQSAAKTNAAWSVCASQGHEQRWTSYFLDTTSAYRRKNWGWGETGEHKLCRRMRWCSRHTLVAWCDELRCTALVKDIVARCHWKAHEKELLRVQWTRAAVMGNKWIQQTLEERTLTHRCEKMV